MRLYEVSRHFRRYLMNYEKITNNKVRTMHGCTNKIRPRAPWHSFYQIVLHGPEPVSVELVNARFGCTDKGPFSLPGYVCGYGWRRSISFGDSTEHLMLVFWRTCEGISSEHKEGTVYTQWVNDYSHTTWSLICLWSECIWPHFCYNKLMARSDKKNNDNANQSSGTVWKPPCM